MLRIGQSTDIHQLVVGRPCILGGITIPSTVGLLGHSDADVLLHVIAEAIFGALGIGDLGDHFPDTAATNKDLDSALLVEYARRHMYTQGYRINNIDTLLICQTPKITPYKSAIKTNVAKLLEVTTEQVNIKATTGEGLGFIGRQEGIMAQAVVLLIKDNPIVQPL